MSERTDRFRSRCALLESRRGKREFPPLADAEKVQEILDQEIDWDLIDSVSLPKTSEINT